MKAILSLLPSGGCTFADDPDVPAWRARVVWDASLDPAVLVVEAMLTPRGDEYFNPATMSANAVLVRSSLAEHIRYDLGQGIIVRLDVIAGTLCAGPTSLHYRLTGIQSAQRQLLRLAQFLSFVRQGVVPAKFVSPDPRFSRFLLALRVHDALAAGASHRDIATILFGAERVYADWRTHSDALLSQTRRLCVLSRRLASGGWRNLLRG